MKGPLPSPPPIPWRYVLTYNCREKVTKVFANLSLLKTASRDIIDLTIYYKSLAKE
jgi:hypothetical protein